MGRLLDLTRDDDAHIGSRLATERIIWLMSVTRDHHPHAVPVWFSWDDPTVLIFSSPDARKLDNLRANSAVTLALDTAAGGGDVVTMTGIADLPDPNEISATSVPAFTGKYAPVVGPDGWAGWADRFRQPIRVRVTRILAWTSTPSGPKVRVVTGTREP